MQCGSRVAKPIESHLADFFAVARETVSVGSCERADPKMELLDIFIKPIQVTLKLTAITKMEPNYLDNPIVF